MSDIINLRLVRKRRERAAESMEADANRLRFGRPLRERRLAEARRDHEARQLDGHRLQDGQAPQGKGRTEP